MKKQVIISLFIISALLIAATVYAGHGRGHGLDCINADIESVKKFQKETLSLRDDLIIKRLEIRQEYNKPNPDKNQIATLKKDVIDLETRIQTTADKYGLPANMGHCMKGHGKMGHGKKEPGCGCMMW
jgi:zinc resistance-associated protein